VDVESLSVVVSGDVQASSSEEDSMRTGIPPVRVH
jgi:hypothetical protein